MELEAKYLINHEDFINELFDKTYWQANELSVIRTRAFSARYFDSSDACLSKAHFSCRYRSEGNDRKLCFKWPLALDVALPTSIKARGELDLDVSDLKFANLNFDDKKSLEAKDFSILGEDKLSELPSDLQEILAKKNLELTYEARFTRKSCELNFSDARIELSVDKGSLITARASENFHEMELELLNGSESRLFSLLDRLDREPSLSVGRLSKLERLIMLARHACPSEQNKLKQAYTSEQSKSKQGCIS